MPSRSATFRSRKEPLLMAAQTDRPVRQFAAWVAGSRPLCSWEQAASREDHMESTTQQKMRVTKALDCSRHFKGHYLQEQCYKRVFIQHNKSVTRQSLGKQEKNNNDFAPGAEKHNKCDLIGLHNRGAKTPAVVTQEGGTRTETAFCLRSRSGLPLWPQ